MQTVAIIAQKGGAGKTTLALHLAAEAERAGRVALVVDMDPQASAAQWGHWREGAPPDVIDSPPPLLARKIEQARGMGAQFVVIDTPPHADAAASTAAQLADIILIPCRPSALDLHAIKLTATLIENSRKPSFVVFTGGNPNAPRLHDDAGGIVRGFGLEVAPHVMPERVVFRNAIGQGRVAYEIEPSGKAADDIAQLWKWISGLAS